MSETVTCMTLEGEPVERADVITVKGKFFCELSPMHAFVI